MLWVDHPTRSNADQKRPLYDHTQNETKPQQVVPCDAIGGWVFEKRHFIFKVENVAEIDEVFS